MRQKVIPFRPIEKAVTADFKAYWDGLDKGRLESPAQQRELLRLAHKLAVCFVTLSRACPDQPEHQSVFLREVASDSVHLVNVLATGDARTARFYLRSVIENFWRHFYFRDHAVEFGWIHEREGYFLEIKAIREHCSWLNCFRGSLKPALDSLSQQYSDLSGFVHSTKLNSLQLKTTLDQISLSVRESKVLQAQLLEVLRSTLVLCLGGEAIIFSSLHFHTQDWLVRSLDAERRRWHQASLDV